MASCEGIMWWFNEYGGITYVYNFSKGIKILTYKELDTLHFCIPQLICSNCQQMQFVGS